MKKPIRAMPSTGHHPRHYVVHDYHDYANEPDDPAKAPVRRRKGGVNVPFPIVLHQTIKRIEEDGYGHIFGWQPHGRAFLIHKPKEFVDVVLPTYFQQSKLTSFQRQLNLYGFNRLTRGVDATGYYHEHFLRDREYLAKRMMRQRIKGTRCKGAADPDSEPDFYRMPPVTATLQEQAQLTATTTTSGSTAGHTHDNNYNNNKAAPRPPTAVYSSRQRRDAPVVSGDDMSSCQEDSSVDDEEDSCARRPQETRSSSSSSVTQRRVEEVTSTVPSMTDYTPQPELITGRDGREEADDDDEDVMFTDPADALLMDLHSMDTLDDFGLLSGRDQDLGEMLHHVLDSSIDV